MNEDEMFRHENPLHAEQMVRHYMKDFIAFASVTALRIAIKAVSHDEDEYKSQVNHLVDCWSRDRKRISRETSTEGEDSLMRELKAINEADQAIRKTLLTEEDK